MRGVTSGPAPSGAAHDLQGGEVAPPAGLNPVGRGPLSEDELVNTTMGIRLPERRRRLRGVVIGAVSACVLILMAAGIARVSRASSEPSTSASSSASKDPGAADRGAGASPAPAPSPPPAAAATPPAADSTSAGPTSGTLRLDRSLVPRWVFLDGKKLVTRSDVVTCGPHQIKVGQKKPRAIDVPCGGELRVSH